MDALNTKQSDNKPLKTIGTKIMAYTISSECISCGACVESCPVDAISEGADQYTIDAESCVDCGACCDSCPVDAITAG